MNVIGEICIPNGTYMKNGEEKTRWLNCGVLMQNKDGHYRIKLDAIPLNPGDGWFSVFAKDKPAQPRAADTSRRDDMPF